MQCKIHAHTRTHTQTYIYICINETINKKWANVFYNHEKDVKNAFYSGRISKNTDWETLQTEKTIHGWLVFSSDKIT